MGKIISVATQKGGAGKSALTMLLASALAVTYDLRVLVVEADSQKTISDRRTEQDQPWLDELRTANPEADFPYPIVYQPMAKVFDYLDSVEGQYDVAFVDMAGRADNTTMIEVLSGCDIILVPLLSDLGERQSTISFLHVLAGIKQRYAERNLPFEFYGVANKRTRAKEEEELDKMIEEYQIPRLSAFLSERAIFKRASTLYSHLEPSFLRWRGGEKTAANELRALCDELIARTGLTAESAA